MFAKQLTVFIENRSGRLSEVLAVLKQNGVNILSMSLADTTEFGLLRLIVNNAALGKEKLSENGPHSVVDHETNQAAVDYIASVLQGYGIVNENTTEKPAYLVQDYIGRGDSRYQNWYSQNVIAYIPANGANPSGNAMMCMGHTDSVPMGNGASDDGIACATMLEAIRYYMQKIENGCMIC